MIVKSATDGKVVVPGMHAVTSKVDPVMIDRLAVHEKVEREPLTAGYPKVYANHTSARFQPDMKRVTV